MSASDDLDLGALLFGAGLSSAGEDVRVALGASELVVRAAAGEVERVDFAALACRAGGFDGGALYFEWRGRAGARSLAVRDEALAALRRDAPLALLERMMCARVRTPRRLYVVAAVVAFMAIALVVLVVALFEPLIDAAVARIPPEWERELGAALASGFAAERVDEGAAARALDELGARLAAQIDSPYAFRFHLVEREDVNALALPGGEVVVFTGLVRAARSPEELAGVLAHEVQHVVLRHSLRAIVRAAGFEAVLAMALGGPAEGGALADTLGELGALRFSRAQERQADRAGAELLARAGVDPGGMAAFFEGLARRSPAQLELLSTHPEPAERARAIRALGLEPARALEPLALDWERVRAELGAGR